MIPNKFVILWDEIPVGFRGFYPTVPFPFKTSNPESIYYFFSAFEAKEALEKYFHNYESTRIIEIQFRIVDSK